MFVKEIGTLTTSSLRFVEEFSVGCQNVMFYKLTQRLKKKVLHEGVIKEGINLDAKL